MRKPDPLNGDPKVVDLKARRRVAELQKQARAAGRPSLRVRAAGPLTAWAILLAAALIWALFRWLQA